MNFAMRIVDWQEAHGRHDLPWQHTRDAYRIWLAEIMLQQTQVKTVIPYYQRFLSRFPTLAALAEARLESVLELWSGLGYYARARNLHRCAQRVAADQGSNFSADPAVNARLPGIGRSTAAAISVFAFSTRAAILDGNVRRVLTRCFALVDSGPAAQCERERWALAESLLPDEKIEAYTQGLMDLGATVCKRHQPLCPVCPLATVCRAWRDGHATDLPLRRAGKPLPQRTKSLLLLTDGRRVLLERMPLTGVWGGLLALPEMVGESAFANARRYGCCPIVSRPLEPLKHTFSHFRLLATIHCCQVAPAPASVAQGNWEWLALTEVATAALPAPVRKYLLALPDALQAATP